MFSGRQIEIDALDGVPQPLQPSMADVRLRNDGEVLSTPTRLPAT
jgi:hypothetical protein